MGTENQTYFAAPTSEEECKLIATNIVQSHDLECHESPAFFRNSSLYLLEAILVSLLREGEPFFEKSVSRISSLDLKSMYNWLKYDELSSAKCRSFLSLVESGSQNAELILSELNQRVKNYFTE